MIKEARQVEWIGAQIDGAAGHRLMVILAAPGCAWAEKTGGCTNCSFPAHFGVGGPVNTDSYVAQLQSALAKMPASPAGPVEIDLFVSGSFLNPDEVASDAQQRLLQLASRAPAVRRVLIETRPEYVTEQRLAEARRATGAAFLEVAIGLESANRDIREKRIRKGFTWRHFEQAARTISSAGAGIVVHTLQKPIDTGEAEAIDDVVETAHRVFTLARDVPSPIRMALQPCFVAPRTPLERAFEAGRYRPPWLWSVVEAVQRIATRGPLQVGLSDEGMGPKRRAHNCGKCDDHVIAALATFNRTASTSALTHLSCPCRDEWQAALA